MIYLLDSNACIQLLNHRQSPVAQHLAQHSPASIALCNVVKGELLYGAYRSQRVEANLRLLHAFFAPFATLPLDERAADHYGQIRTDLMGKGTPIGPNDLLIAAIARAHDATLITHNSSEFGRVAGLRMEDWEVA